MRGERHNVADDSVRRRVDDDAVVVGARPLEEVGHGRGTEYRRGRHSIWRKRTYHVKPGDSGFVDKFRFLLLIIFALCVFVSFVETKDKISELFFDKTNSFK